jgi:hypothetical protein
MNKIKFLSHKIINTLPYSIHMQIFGCDQKIKKNCIHNCISVNINFIILRKLYCNIAILSCVGHVPTMPFSSPHTIFN